MLTPQLPDPSVETAVWLPVEGTETQYVGPIVQLMLNHDHDSAIADLLVAYPASYVHEGKCVRIDFLDVVSMRFTSELQAVKSVGSTVAVTDSSLWKSEMMAIMDPSMKVFSARGTAIGPPAEMLRHFQLSVDHFGRTDVLAREVVVREFTTERLAGVSHLEHQFSILSGALELRNADR